MGRGAAVDAANVPLDCDPRRRSLRIDGILRMFTVSSSAGTTSTLVCRRRSP
jgi:hypothetical protein